MMRTLFADRRLVSSFRNRSVVYTARSVVNEKNVFMTQIDLEFGANGPIALKTVVPLNAVYQAKGAEVFAEQLSFVQEKLNAHLKTINEYIRLFDETIAWVNDPERRFNLVTTLGFNPLIVHSTLCDNEVKIEVFGRNIRDLNLGFETGNATQLAHGVQRLNDLRECLVDYRDKFSAVDIGIFVNKR